MFSSDIHDTSVRRMLSPIPLICALMLLMVNVSGKNYIVETEDDLDLTSENDGRMSNGKGCPKALKEMRQQSLIQITWGGNLQPILMLCLMLKL